MSEITCDKPDYLIDLMCVESVASSVCFLLYGQAVGQTGVIYNRHTPDFSESIIFSAHSTQLCPQATHKHFLY